MKNNPNYVTKIGIDELRQQVENIAGGGFGFSLFSQKQEPDNMDQILLAIVADHLEKKSSIANLDFEGESGELYSIFEVKVILKRVKVCYPGMSITIPAVFLILLLSGSVGQAVKNLIDMVEDARRDGDTAISALNCKCWETWPIRQGA